MKIHESTRLNNAITILTLGSLIVGIYLSLKSLDKLKTEDNTLQERVNSAEDRLKDIESRLTELDGQILEDAE